MEDDTMQLLHVAKQEPFASFYFSLTWRVGWEQMLFFCEALIESDLIKKPQSIRCEVSSIGSKPKDVTKQLKTAEYKIMNAPFAQNEMGELILTGYSTTMESTIHIIFYNQTDRCLLQVLGLDLLEKEGEHVFEKFADSIEIMGYVHAQKHKSTGSCKEDD